MYPYFDYLPFLSYKRGDWLIRKWKKEDWDDAGGDIDIVKFIRIIDTHRFQHMKNFYRISNNICEKIDIFNNINEIFFDSRIETQWRKMTLLEEIYYERIINKKKKI